MFETLSVGDRIAVVQSFTLEKHVAIVVVTRITATQVHLSGGERFRRDTGSAIGHKGSHKKYIADVDSCEVMDSLARRRMSRLLYELSTFARTRPTFASRDGVLKGLGEIRDQVDATIGVLIDGEKLAALGEKS